MAVSNNRKKKFVVLAAVDEKSPIGIHAILSEDRDTACHRAEIALDSGMVLALNKKQTRHVCANLKRCLQNW